ncbi:MAG: tryptophan synthase subunit alpha, partial [Rothia dentocariosa]
MSAASRVTLAAAKFSAMRAGVTTDTVFDLLASVKGTVHKPLVFLVYYNLVFAYGVDAFLQKCAEVG